MHTYIRPLAVAVGLACVILVYPLEPVFGQEPLTLDDAVARAVRQHPSIRAARAGVREAEARADQARSAWLPRLDVTEAWQRGDQPVFVFGSLLAQRQFQEANFAVDALNYPPAITNYRTAISVEQLVFDGGRRESGVRQAQLGEQLASLQGQDAALALRVAATQAYGEILMALAQSKASDAALQSADEDLRRAERRRDAGMGTDADVLALRVHQARMRERQITARSRESIARAQLNDVMGEPLDRVYALQLPSPPAEELPAPGDMEPDALTRRADVGRARVAETLAREGQAASRAAFWPSVGVQGGWEFNGGSFTHRAQAWGVGAFIRWNLFSGLGDVARRREAVAATERAQAERERLESAVKVELRIAVVRIEEARAREAVGRSARLQAQESQRIIRDRYEAGLASASDVLRAAEAVLESELQYTTAVVDVLVSAAMLDRARGR